MYDTLQNLAHKNSDFALKCLLCIAQVWMLASLPLKCHKKTCLTMYIRAFRYGRLSKAQENMCQHWCASMSLRSPKSEAHTQFQWGMEHQQQDQRQMFCVSVHVQLWGVGGDHPQRPSLHMEWGHARCTNQQQQVQVTEAESKPILRLALKLSSNCFFGWPWWQLPDTNSPQNRWRGILDSSMLMTWPIHRSWAWRILASTFIVLALSSTYWFVMQSCHHTHTECREHMWNCSSFLMCLW